jgi:hypothetical protein
MQQADLQLIGESQALASKATSAKRRLAGFVEDNLDELLEGVTLKGIGNVRVILRREIQVRNED